MPRYNSHVRAGPSASSSPRNVPVTAAFAAHCTPVATATPTGRTLDGNTSAVTMYGTGPKLQLKLRRNTRIPSPPRRAMATTIAVHRLACTHCQRAEADTQADNTSECHRFPPYVVDDTRDPQPARDLQHPDSCG
eukprot:CAMPEP_0181395226 /NCGR_PEP_ID=MMETSP1106-20121128/28223_1 /TAXON_ID=81844 /ORGANISM="Mantoniella antarctica, Strain SL-175" /LENGTH=134 /DNA_ID=CAMNT_0023516825 /DNA_START=113 /DNA_END=518 /DNA_ORIENTATION=-